MLLCLSMKGDFERLAVVVDDEALTNNLMISNCAGSRFFPRLCQLGVLLGLIGVLESGHGQSRTFVWDPVGGVGSTGSDGSGVWSSNASDGTRAGWYSVENASQTTWTETIVPGYQTLGLDTVAVFGSGGNAGTITLGAAGGGYDGVVYVGGLTFNAVPRPMPTVPGNAYRFAGAGRLQFRDGAVIQVDGEAAASTGGFMVFNTNITAHDLTIRKTGGTIGYLELGTTGVKDLTGTLTVDSANGQLFLRSSAAANLNGLELIVVGANSTMAINGTAGTYSSDFRLAGTGSSSRGVLRMDSNAVLNGTVTLTADAAIATENATRMATLAGSVVESGGSRALTIRQNASNAGGTVVLAGDNRFTGGLRIQGGTVRLGHVGALNSGRPNTVIFEDSAYAKTLELNGFSTVVGGLSSAAGAGVGLNTVQNASAVDATLTVRSAVDTTFSGVIQDGGAAGNLSLVKEGAGRLTLNRASLYTGETVVAGGTLQLDFNAAGAPLGDMIDADSSLEMRGGTLLVSGKSGSAVTQTFDGLLVDGGSSVVALLPNSGGVADVLVDVGAITRADGVVSFLLPGLTNVLQTVTNGVRTSNADGFMGHWATVNRRDWASVSGGNVVAFDGYTEITRLGPGNVIVNNAASHIKIVAGGTTGNVSMAAAGVTNVASLVSSSTGMTVIGLGGTNTLRLAADGGILIAENAGVLHLGAAGGDGFLTAGTGANSGGQISVTNYFNTTESRINARITDDGTGAVSVVHNGTGRTVFGSSNGYTGGTFFDGGTFRIGIETALGAAPAAVDDDNLVFNGGALNVTSITVNSNRGMELREQGGTLNADTQLIYGGVIKGQGSLTKTGNGFLRLEGNNTYTGETLVSQGNLQVGVAGLGRTGLGAVFLNGTTATTILSGTGIVQGMGQILVGTVKPGDNLGAMAGTLRFSSGLAFAPTTANAAVAEFNLFSASSADMFDVTGDLSMNSLTKFQVNFDAGYSLMIGDSWTLATWTGELMAEGFDFGETRDGSGDNATNFDLPDLTTLTGYAGQMWAVSTADKALTITVTPEPGRAMLLLLAGAVWLTRRRRGKNSFVSV